MEETERSKVTRFQWEYLIRNMPGVSRLTHPNILFIHAVECGFHELAAVTNNTKLYVEFIMENVKLQIISNDRNDAVVPIDLREYGQWMLDEGLIHDLDDFLAVMRDEGGNV